MAGPSGNHMPGESLQMDERTERELVARGFAVPVKEPGEAAVVRPQETAAMPAARRGRKG